MPNKQVPSCMIRTVLCSREQRFIIHNTYRVHNSASQDAGIQILKFLLLQGGFKTRKIRGNPSNSASAQAELFQTCQARWTSA